MFIDRKMDARTVERVSKSRGEEKREAERRERVWRRGLSGPFYFEPHAQLGQQQLPITTRKSIESIGDRMSYLTKYAADSKDVGFEKMYRFGEMRKRMMVEISSRIFVC